MQDVLDAELTIYVGGEPHRVRIYQESESVWTAVGDFSGKRVEIKGRSEMSALGGWRLAARHQWEWH